MYKLSNHLDFSVSRIRSEPELSASRRWCLERVDEEEGLNDTCEAGEDNECERGPRDLLSVILEFGLERDRDILQSRRSPVTSGDADAMRKS